MDGSSSRAWWGFLRESGEITCYEERARELGAWTPRGSELAKSVLDAGSS